MRLNFFCFAQKKCKCFREQQTGNVLPKNFISKKGFSRIVYVKQFQKEKNNNIQLSRRSISIWKRFFVLLSNEKIFMKGKKNLYFIYVKYKVDLLFEFGSRSYDHHYRHRRCRRLSMCCTW